MGSEAYYQVKIMTSVKILFVAEAWGESEDKFQHPLVGASGREFAFMLSNVDLAPSVLMYCPKCRGDSYFPECSKCRTRLYPNELDMIRHWKLLRDKYGIAVTNVFQAHPPDNDLGYFFDNESRDNWMPPVKLSKQPGRFLKHEYRHHLLRLWTEVADLQPNLVVCLGNSACWAILKQTAISQIRGTVQRGVSVDVKCLPTYHPAGVLRQWSWRPIVLADFTKAKHECEFPEIRRIERWITLCDTYDPDYLDEIEHWLNLPADRYCIDVESGYVLYTRAEIKNMTPLMRRLLSEQLSMVGFARSPYDAMVIPFMTRASADLSYWPTPREEIRAWNLCQQGLASNAAKIFQNGMYDINRLLYSGMKVAKPRFDTMLHHHSVYPEMQKGLGFLGSIYSNETSWKQMYKQGESLKRDE